ARELLLGEQASLDALGELDLLLGVQQRDLADLLEVVLDRIGGRTGRDDLLRGRVVVVGVGVDEAAVLGVGVLLLSLDRLEILRLDVGRRHGLLGLGRRGSLGSRLLRRSLLRGGLLGRSLLRSRLRGRRRAAHGLLRGRRALLRCALGRRGLRRRTLRGSLAVLLRDSAHTGGPSASGGHGSAARTVARLVGGGLVRDRKSTRLNSSHVKSSYAVFCLKKKSK